MLLEFTQMNESQMHRMIKEIYIEGCIENAKEKYPESEDLTEAIKEEEAYFMTFLEKFFNKEENKYYILEVEEGWVSALRLTKLDGFFYMESLETAPQYRGKGYATRLIREVILLLEQRGSVVIRSSVGKKNIPSRETHRKCKFEIENENAVNYLSGETNEHCYGMLYRKTISIEEIPVENIQEFWDIHIKYLVDDGIISDEEDIEYFSGDEYRDIIREHMIRPVDKHHVIYFVREGVRIGAAQYNTYQSEDGKCFMLDFWVFPEFRGNGTGHECFSAFEKYTKSDGAIYYELNSQKENSIRFWKSLGFVENGEDEWGDKLFVKK